MAEARKLSVLFVVIALAFLAWSAREVAVADVRDWQDLAAFAVWAFALGLEFTFYFHQLPRRR